MKASRIFIISLFIIALMAILWVPTESQFQVQNGEPPEYLLAGRNVNMVSGITLPGGDPYLQRQNEPSIAVSSRNPLHLLAGSNDYRTVDMLITGEELPGIEEMSAADAWVGVYTSYDGGESWTSTLLDGYPQSVSNSPLKNYTTATDPIVKAGIEGRFYYSGLAFDRGGKDNAIFVARFQDNNDRETGNTIEYQGVSIVATGNAGKFLDMPRMAVDVPRSSGPGNVYIAYTEFTGNLDKNIRSKIMLSRSTNGGLTWSNPIKISESQHIIQGAQIAIDPNNGDVFVTFRRFYHKSQDSGIILVKSTDGGQTFSSPSVLATFTTETFDQPATPHEYYYPDPNDYVPGESFRTNSYPTIAVDQNHRVYVAWSQRGLGDSGEARIVMMTSFGGSGWDGPTQIGPFGLDPNGRPYTQGHQLMPQLSFSTGKLTLVWYDQHEDWEAIAHGYGHWISDYFPDERHVLDVWVAQTDSLNYPAFDWAYAQVTRYLYALLVDENGNIEEINGMPYVYPVQFNCPNYPLFKEGILPFFGDYIDITPSKMFLVDEYGNWRFNTDPSDNPVFHVTWTDNRDVRPPLDNDWTDYTPPVSTQSDVFESPGRTECSIGGNKIGMRNQNIYTSKISWGVMAGSPTNTKSLDLGDVARMFVVFVKNNTGGYRSFRLEIENQPDNGEASFLQFDFIDQLDATIAPFSTISRPVFIKSSTDVNATITVNIWEITEPGGSVIGIDPASQIIINGDPSNTGVYGDEETHDPVIDDPENPNIVNWLYTNPNIVNPNIVNPNIVNPNIVNPNIVNPNIVNPNIVNPNIVNPNIVNPNIVNPNIVNPNIVNPNIVNPNIVNPNIVNPNIVNPNIVNAGVPGDIDEVPVTDVEWTVRNNGNTATSYSLKTLSKKAPPAGVYAHLLVYKVHYTPAVIGTELNSELPNYEGCTLYEEPHHELILNIPNPNIVNPNIVNPNIVNPNIVNAAIENATFSLGPGEEAKVTLRMMDTGEYPTTGTLTAQNRTSLHAINIGEFIDSLDFVVTDQAVESEEVAYGETTVKATATSLYIANSFLPDGYAHQYYETQLTAVGGEDPYTWDLTDGLLPSGITLSTGGLISGTPSSVGTYHFSLEVKDSSSPQQSDTQHYTITIYAGTTPDPLTITTTVPLPTGVVNTWYGLNLEATGGQFPRTWSLVTGPLPPGLSLDSGGLISGTPTATGTYPFLVRVIDDNGQFVNSAGFSITINTYTGVSITISGNVYDENGNGIDGVVMRGMPNTPVTDDYGYYSDTVPQGWTGTAEPFKPDFAFNPASRTYTNIQSSVSGQDYNELVIATMEWVQRFDGPGTNSLDRLQAMTTDSAGNIYVTGYSYGSGTIADVATIKYNSAGTPLWVARYSSASNYGDSSYDIAVDTNGNVYVTGYTSDALDLNSNYLTIKYDSSGNQQWVATYDSPDHNTDTAQAVAVDTNGNVFVTGYSHWLGYNYDYITIKYDSSGNQQWMARYDGPPSDYDRPYDIAVDSSGNVFVTGESYDLTTNRDITTIKYDTNGNEEWVARHDSGNGYDRPAGIAMDASGNPLVIGRSRGPVSGDTDYVTIKYDTIGGSPIWTSWFDDPGAYDLPFALTLDSSGNVYVTGESSLKYGTVKYNSSGVEQWRAFFDNPGHSNAEAIARAIGVDSSGNVYVTGYALGSADYYEFATVKYDSSGTEQWVSWEDGPGNGDDVPAALVVDPSGNVIVSGRSHGGSSNDDFVTAKLDSANGNTSWIQTYNGPSNDDEISWYNRFLVVDSSGNVIIAGDTIGNGTSFDFTTVKYNSNGNLQWTQRYNGPGNYIDQVEDLAVDGAGNVYVTGITRNGQNVDWATVKYSSGGALLWANTYDGPINAYDQAYGIAVDASGNAYVTGSHEGSGGYDDFVTIKYNSAGAQQWVATYDGSAGYMDNAYDVALDASGNVYVTGASYGIDYNLDFAVVKYDSSGNQLWVGTYDGPDNLDDFAYFVDVDAAGNVYVCGESYGNGTDSDYAIVKFNSAGIQQWAARYNGPGNGMDWPLGFVSDSAGNTYVTGMSMGTGTFRDFATAKYDTSGNLMWVARYDAPLNSYDYGRELVVDSAGNVYVAGRTAETNKHADITTIKYDSVGNQVWIMKYNGPENDSYDGGAGIAIDGSGNVYVGGLSSGIGTGFDFVVIKYKD